MARDPFNSQYGRMTDGVAPDDETQSQRPKEITTSDGMMHVFAPDTLDTDIERFHVRWVGPGIFL